MSQLPLFSKAGAPAGSDLRSRRPDPESERLLAVFRDARLAQDAHPSSVRREVSQLRAILRDAGVAGQTVSLRALFADLERVARVLCEPPRPIARSTGRTRLLVVQR